MVTALPWRLMIALCVFGAASAASASQSDPLIAAYVQPLERPAPRVKQPQKVFLAAITRAGDRLVAVGEHGVITLSDDNGRTWRQANVPVDVNLTAVAFVDRDHGWAIGHQGAVLASEDGGEHWQKRLDGKQVAQLVLEQAQREAEAIPDSDRQEFLSPAQRLIEDGADKPFLAIQLEGSNQITFIGAFGLGLRSNDAGRSWHALYNQLSSSEGLHLYAIQGQGAHTWVAGEQGLLLKDMGDGQFVKQPSPYEGSYFGLLTMGPDELIAFGLRGNVFRSEDGGQHWQQPSIRGARATFNAAVQVDEHSLILLDQAGRLYSSNDNGRNFQSVPFEWGAPLTGATLAADGALIITSLAGIAMLPASTLVQIHQKVSP
ncbi:WD40/YVTN/BNR-like repeat-containing protein [Pseudomonas putida]|uniref:Bnr domain-containing protein n=1 Tax=Pseudomonas putida TaxID=303 RepID=A0A1L7NF69_PSEPU|nr:YCF48-related protein [Pseudomonas putida]BAW24131.1 Bnr domain-containing protein [Pseudomonas putida]